MAVEAQILNQLLNSLTKDEKIILESVNDNISINTNKTTTLLKSQESEDFPKIPRIIDGYNLSLPLLSFILAVKSVIYASSISDIKPEISSVYIYQTNGYLYFVATDSFRLAEKRIVWQGNDNFLPLIIPFKNINNIIRILDQEDGDLEIQATENQISFITNNFYLTSRVINSIFPDYRQIIPKESKTHYIYKIMTFFEQERDEQIGVIAAEEVLTFFLQSIGPAIYNKGIQDASSVIKEKTDGIALDLDALKKAD